MIGRILVVSCNSILETTLRENLLTLIVVDDVDLVSNDKSCMLLAVCNLVVIRMVSSQNLLLVVIIILSRLTSYNDIIVNFLEVCDALR
jgi:hypothetical protein